MTRDLSQGTPDTPAWLGDDPGDDPGDTVEGQVIREPVPMPPAEAFPLWPAEVGNSGPAHAADLRTADLRTADPHAGDLRAADVRSDTKTRPEPARRWAEDPNDRPGIGVIAVTGRRPMRPPSSPRPVRRPPRRHSTGAALVALVLLALLSAFFAWVTAEPLWLAVGHAQPGTVAVTGCVDHGVDRQCTGTFSSADGRFTRTSVPVMGDPPEVGATAPARMTSDRGARAYVDVDAASRAATGLVLIVLCGLGIVRSTGVRRLPTRATRRVATLLSLAAPLSLLAAMLAATY